MKLLSKKTGLLITATMVLTSSQLLATNLKTEIDKESYSIGASTGQYIGNTIVRQSELGLEVDVDRVVEGFVDALQKKVKLKEEDVIQYLNDRAKKLNTAQENEIIKLKADNKKREDEFLAKNRTKEGVIVTKSGLQYEATTKGKGANVRPESVVVVNYKAYLPDGSVFEDNQDKKKPVQLSMVNIIDGLREGLLLMNAGSKYNFVIPSTLAYGEKGVDVIPPNTPVIFEVELHQILKPGELKPKEKYEIIMEEKNKSSKPWEK